MMPSNLTSIVSVLLTAAVMQACSPARQLNRTAHTLIVDKPELKSAHVGICVYDADKAQYLYQYQSDKYFVPASNAKLFSMYAALRNLGDSLPGIRYAETRDSIYLQPAGDPSFLHPDFKSQPIFDWLKATDKEIVINDNNWNEKPLGYGWSWDDFNSDYMAERSPLPVYGNVIKWTQVIEKTTDPDGKPADDAFIYSEPEVDWKVQFNPMKSNVFSVARERDNNIFHITQGKEILRTIAVPFVTNSVLSALDLLRDTLGKSIVYVPAGRSREPNRIRYSQPLDSLLKPMMYNSDNFFAEQCLLMVSQKLLREMDEQKLIDTLMRSDFKDLPQEPRWVDGSGLSRYNQFTPEDMVWVLRKMEQEFSRKRIETILPGANQGTFRGYFKEMPGAIFAKTGSLSGQAAISGYLYTKKGKRLVFSILVNNHNTSGTKVRRATESFLENLYNQY